MVGRSEKWSERGIGIPESAEKRDGVETTGGKECRGHSTDSVTNLKLHRVTSYTPSRRVPERNHGHLGKTNVCTRGVCVSVVGRTLTDPWVSPLWSYLVEQTS